MTPSHELLPCPFCGCDNVYTYIAFDVAVVRCQQCTATLKNNSAIVHYHKDSCPKELVEVETYEPTLLTIIKDGKEIHYPDHGYKGVSAMLAFKAYGVLDAWNTRTHPTGKE